MPANHERWAGHWPIGPIPCPEEALETAEGWRLVREAVARPTHRHGDGSGCRAEQVALAVMLVSHFTPTSSSWMNLVERWFAELTNEQLKRGAHRYVRELNTDIRAWIDTRNENPRPYVWTKTADQILDSIARYCGRTNDSRHWPRVCQDSMRTRGESQVRALDTGEPCWISVLVPAATAVRTPQQYGVSAR